MSSFDCLRNKLRFLRWQGWKRYQNRSMNKKCVFRIFNQDLGSLDPKSSISTSKIKYFEQGKWIFDPWSKGKQDIIPILADLMIAYTLSVPTNWNETNNIQNDHQHLVSFHCCTVAAFLWLSSLHVHIRLQERRVIAGHVLLESVNLTLLQKSKIKSPMSWIFNTPPSLESDVTN